MRKPPRPPTEFWDCECPEGYTRPRADAVCPKCGATCGPRQVIRVRGANQFVVASKARND